MMLTGPSLTPLVSLICALTVYAPTCAYYLQTCKDDRGFFVSINGIRIRPLAQDTVDTRRKALEWTLELYRLYASGV